MSSFINSAKHFNSIEQKLKRLLRRDFRGWHSLKDVTPGIYTHWTNGVFTESDEQEITEIINTLRDLSVLCVSLQYKHHYEGSLDAEIATQKKAVRVGTDTALLSLHGLYNALNCVMYQIEIEHLQELRELTKEESKALEFVEKITSAIAMQIVDELPDDSTCTWSM